MAYNNNNNNSDYYDPATDNNNYRYDDEDDMQNHPDGRMIEEFNDEQSGDYVDYNRGGGGVYEPDHPYDNHHHVTRHQSPPPHPPSYGSGPDGNGGARGGSNHYRSSTTGPANLYMIPPRTGEYPVDMGEIPPSRTYRQPVHEADENSASYVLEEDNIYDNNNNPRGGDLSQQQQQPPPYNPNRPGAGDESFISGEGDDRTAVTLSTNVTGAVLTNQQMIMELRDPSYLITTLEELVPKIINHQYQHSQQSSFGGGGGGADSGGGTDARDEKLKWHEQQRRDQADQVWERVRRWLWANPSVDLTEGGEDVVPDDNSFGSMYFGNAGANTRAAGAYVRGQNDMTPLHFICKLQYPPEDIVGALLAAAPDTASWADSYGWLPLHHACANGCSTDVLTMLIDAYADGKIQQDQQKRTPMHFYATRSSHVDNPTTMAANAALLCQKVGRGVDAISAAQLRDSNGMLPIHYACAYGTHPNVLKALATAHPNGLTARERNGRTPMHFAMVNASREESQAVIQFLLDYSPVVKNTINARDKQGYLPLHLLAAGLKQQAAISKNNRVADAPEKRAIVSECLSLYLAAEPKAAADFLTAIKDLPEWLQDTAVVSRHVRNMLNEKIVQRFPTSILMLDGIILMTLIVCFGKTTHNHIDLRFDPDNSDNHSQGSLALVLVGASYFLLREFVQFTSLMSLGNISQWFSDPANWLDMAVIVMVFYYGVLMLISDTAVAISVETFRAGTAFTQGILWVATIVYLKSTLVDFAVFVGGVFYVLQRLVAFLIAVGVILLAFAQMFYFVYVNTEICGLPATVKLGHFTLPDGQQIDTSDLDGCFFPHCTFERSLLKVYTMMMGEINDATRYSTNLVGQILYVMYGFLVVILLSNVLIAVVQDSYEVIQNDRAAIVFWSNRLDFVAEMDSIMYAIQRRLGLLSGSNVHNKGYAFAYDGDEFDDDADDKGVHRGRVANKKKSGAGGDMMESHPLSQESNHYGSELNSGSRHYSTTGDSEFETTTIATNDRSARRGSLQFGGSGNGTTPMSSNTTPDYEPNTNLPEGEDLDENVDEVHIDYFREGWHQIMSLFDSSFYDDIDWIESYVYNIFRLFSLLCIIPLWLVLGFITAGWLWPPQVREYLFVQKETAISRAELELQKLSQLKAIQADLKELKLDIMREMAHDRDEMIRLKADVETVHGEVYADLTQIKELMDSLLVLNNQY